MAGPSYLKDAHTMGQSVDLIFKFYQGVMMPTPTCGREIGLNGEKSYLGLVVPGVRLKTAHF